MVRTALCRSALYACATWTPPGYIFCGSALDMPAWWFLRGNAEQQHLVCCNATSGGAAFRFFFLFPFHSRVLCAGRCLFVVYLSWPTIGSLAITYDVLLPLPTALPDSPVHCRPAAACLFACLLPVPPLTTPSVRTDAVANAGRCWWRVCRVDLLAGTDAGSATYYLPQRRIDYVCSTCPGGSLRTAATLTPTSAPARRDTPYTLTCLPLTTCPYSCCQ